MDLQTLIDREKIRDLRNQYSTYVDFVDLDKLANLFTEDGRCEFPEAFGPAWVGRDEIRANYSKQLFGKEFDTQHVTTNGVIEIEGDRAFGRWYLIDIGNRVPDSMTKDHAGLPNSPIFFTGLYEDEYVRNGDGWLFKRIRLQLFWPNKGYDGLTRSI